MTPDIGRYAVRLLVAALLVALALFLWKIVDVLLLAFGAVLLVIVLGASGRLFGREVSAQVDQPSDCSGNGDHLRQCDVWLQADETKGKHAEFVQASEEAMLVLERLVRQAREWGQTHLLTYQHGKKGKRNPVKNPRRAWNTAMKRLGLKHRFYDTKASFVTAVARVAFGAVTKTLARHKDHRTTERYIEIVDPVKREAVQAIQLRAAVGETAPSPRQESQTDGVGTASRRRPTLKEKAPELLSSGAFRRFQNGRSDRIRTCDPQTPSLMRYQAALRSVPGTGVGRDYSGAGWATQRFPVTFFSPHVEPRPRPSKDCKRRSSSSTASISWRAWSGSMAGGSSGSAASSAKRSGVAGSSSTSSAGGRGAGPAGSEPRPSFSRRCTPLIV